MVNTDAIKRETETADKFATQCEAMLNRISTSNHEAMVAAFEAHNLVIDKKFEAQAEATRKDLLAIVQRPDDMEARISSAPVAGAPPIDIEEMIQRRLEASLKPLSQ